MRQIPTKSGLEYTFEAPPVEGSDDAPVRQRPSILPAARARIAGAVVKLDMARPDIVTGILVGSPEDSSVVLSKLVATEGDRGAVTATAALARVADLAIANWWQEWCPNPVPRNVLLADVGVTNWRAGMRYAAFVALSDGGARGIASWLRHAADSRLPELLIELLRADAQDAIDALGPNHEEAAVLQVLLRTWDTEESVPADTGEFEDLWRRWDASQVESFLSLTMASAALSAAAPPPMFMLGTSVGLSYSRLRSNKSTRSQPTLLPDASVDWHAVPARTLVADEESIHAVLEPETQRLEITVKASPEATNSDLAGLVAQLVDAETGRLLGHPIPLRRGPGNVLRAIGTLSPEPKKSAAKSAVPHVRHVSYTGPIRVGASAAAARAQRDAIRARVALRTDAARDWLGLDRRPELSRRIRHWMAEARLALSEAAPDAETPMSLEAVAPQRESEAALHAPPAEGLALPPRARPVLLAEAFLALAEDR